MKTLGFIGTGTITTAFVEGLVASGRRNPILISPRSAQRADALAARFETVSRAASNAEVARDSDIVFLAMRPAQVEEALKGIAFRPGQIVCSFVTGLTVPAIGAYAPGGAFQGGAVLAAVGLLLLLSRLYRPRPGHRPVARLGFVLGTATFAAVALLVAGGGRMPFEYPAEHAKTLILLIEGVVTLSIAVTLAALFHGREPEAITVSEKRV